MYYSQTDSTTPKKAGKRERERDYYHIISYFLLLLLLLLSVVVVSSIFAFSLIKALVLSHFEIDNLSGDDDIRSCTSSDNNTVLYQRAM